MRTQNTDTHARTHKPNMSAYLHAHTRAHACAIPAHLMIAGGSKNVHAAGTSDAVAPLKSRSRTALRACTISKHRPRASIGASDNSFSRRKADRRTTMPGVRRRCVGAPALSVGEAGFHRLVRGGGGERKTVVHCNGTIHIHTHTHKHTRTHTTASGRTDGDIQTDRQTNKDERPSGPTRRIHVRTYAERDRVSFVLTVLRVLSRIHSREYSLEYSREY
jgi:hypothetical protein